MESVQALVSKMPEPVQERLFDAMMKAAQDKYYIPTATIPVVYLLAYIPHFTAAALKVLYSGVNYNNDTPRNEDMEKFPALVKRLAGAHYNSLEMLAPYTTAVILARVTKANPAELTALCIQYVKFRVAYVLAYGLGCNFKLINAVRTAIWGQLFMIVFKIFGKSL